MYAAPVAEAPRAPQRRDAFVLRVALATAARSGVVSGTSRWRVYDRDGRDVQLRGTPDEPLTIERSGNGVRAVNRGGFPTTLRNGPWTVRAAERGAMLRWNAHRYRGELVISAGDSGLTVVNRLGVEDYLRGVVPLEIGDRPLAELAASQAQAVAARSYAYIHSRGRESAAYDLVADVSHQVYGGADAERPGSDSAVASTAGRVLLYAGRVVDAPYHAVCGGSTAEATEVWRTTGQPYLRAVSDRIPGSPSRYYCDPSPRFSWSRSYTGPSLAAVLDRYLRAYAPVPSGGVGSARSVVVSGLSPSGRVATLDIATDAGRYTLRGNDIRFVLRSPGGEILSSTYFSVETSVGRDGRLVQLTLRGAGYGHGIGMCQWGAIGRARAGQDYLGILQTYYPGTRVGPMPVER